MNALNKSLACVGSWHGSNRLHDPNTNAPEDSPATVAVTTLLHDRFVRLDYTWAYQGSPQAGSLLIGYEPQAKLATGHWVDTWHMGYKAMASVGTISQNGEISVRGSYAAPPGPDWGWRTIITPGDGQQLRLTMFNISPDGQEELAVEAHYNRGS